MMQLLMTWQKTVTMDDQQLKIEQLTSALENMEVSRGNGKARSEYGAKNSIELIHDYNLENRIAEQNHEMEKLTAELKTLESDRVERDQLQLEVTELKTHIECCAKNWKTVRQQRSRAGPSRDLENQHTSTSRDSRTASAS